MAGEDSVFKRKEGKIIITLFFIVVVFLILLNAWDRHHPKESGAESVQTSTSASRVETAYEVLSETIPVETSQSKTAAENSENEEWKLLLVNRRHKLPKGYKVTLKKFGKSQSVDKRIYPSLKKMFAAAENDGMNPVVVSSYRTDAQQKKIRKARIKFYIKQGYSKKEAVSITDTFVAKPGYSEHQTGLAVDINAEEGKGDELYEWLEENSCKYGFIVRYPDDKSSITGIDYEPWHFRYVGKKAAEYIHKHNLTLEEYLEKADKK